MFQKSQRACFCRTNESIKNRNKDAIIVTVLYVNDCLAKRLKLLVESASSQNRDVWVLTSHHLFDPRFKNSTFSQHFDSQYKLILEDDFIHSHSIKLQRSRQHIKSIPGLHSANQSPIRNLPFEGSLAGSSKSSFLKFIAHYGYKSAWLLEDDVFFTGDWRVFFDVLDKIDADVLTAFHKEIEIEDPWWSKSRLNRCWVSVNQEKLRCKDISPTKSAWFAIRTSHNIATSLLNDLYIENTKGYHEDIIGSYASVHNFTIKSIPSALMGVAKVGNSDEDIDVPKNETSQLRSHSPVLRNKVYHPVKCTAYQYGEMNDVLMKWTNWKG